MKLRVRFIMLWTLRPIRCSRRACVARALCTAVGVNYPKTPRPQYSASWQLWRASIPQRVRSPKGHAAGTCPQQSLRLEVMGTPGDRGVKPGIWLHPFCFLETEEVMSETLRRTTPHTALRAMAKSRAADFPDVQWLRLRETWLRERVVKPPFVRNGENSGERSSHAHRAHPGNVRFWHYDLSPADRCAVRGRRYSRSRGNDDNA